MPTYRLEVVLSAETSEEEAQRRLHRLAEAAEAIGLRPRQAVGAADRGLDVPLEGRGDFKVTWL